MTDKDLKKANELAQANDLEKRDQQAHQDEVKDDLKEQSKENAKLQKETDKRQEQSDEKGLGVTARPVEANPDLTHGDASQVVGADASEDELGKERNESQEAGTVTSEDFERANDPERVAMGFSGVTPERYAGTRFQGGGFSIAPTSFQGEGTEADLTLKRGELFTKLNSGELDDEVKKEGTFLGKAPENVESEEDEKAEDRKKTADKAAEKANKENETANSGHDTEKAKIKASRKSS